VNTLFFLIIYRLGAHVVLPGVNPNELATLKSQTSGGILGLLDMFAGGAFSHASIFALGIMPYISASIVLQLLGIAIPYFQKLQKEGESGRKKINQYTRYLTVLICAFQAPGYLVNLKSQAAGAIISVTNPELVSPFMFTLTSVIILMAGTIFVMWLGEKITDKGLGNGISLIIMVGIIARLPASLKDEFVSRLGSGGMIAFLIEIVAQETLPSGLRVVCGRSQQCRRDVLVRRKACLGLSHAQTNVELRRRRAAEPNCGNCERGEK